MFYYSYLLQLHDFHLFQLLVPERGVLVFHIMVIDLYSPPPFLNIAQVSLRLKTLLGSPKSAGNRCVMPHHAFLVISSASTSCISLYLEQFRSPCGRSCWRIIPSAMTNWLFLIIHDVYLYNIVYIDTDPSLLFWLACISIHIFCICFSVSVESTRPHGGIFTHSLLVFSHYLPHVLAHPQCSLSGSLSTVIYHTYSIVLPPVSPLSPSPAPHLLSHTRVDKNENLGPHIREKCVASFLLNLGYLTRPFSDLSSVLKMTPSHFSWWQRGIPLDICVAFPLDGHLGWSHLLSIMNSAAMNIDVQVSLR